MEDNSRATVVAISVEKPIRSAQQKDNQYYNTIIVSHMLAFLFFSFRLVWDDGEAHATNLLIVLADTGRNGGRKKKVINAKIMTTTQMFTSQPIHPRRRKVRSWGKNSSDLRR